MNRIACLTFVSTLALGLAACGNATETSEAEEAEPAPAYVLSAIQQGSFDRFNREEYRENLTAIVGETPEGEGFAAYDLDKDGKISPPEFTLWKLASDGMPVTDVAALTDEQTEEALGFFFSFDLDGDDKLDESEFASASGEPSPEETPEAPE